MFGSLHRFGRGAAAHIFNDQVHNNLTALVLHLNDENAKVQLATKGALRKLGPLIGSDEVRGVHVRVRALVRLGAHVCACVRMLVSNIILPL